MPLPSKSGKESRDAYMQKCMHFLKDEKRPQAQKVAMCLTNFRNAKKRKLAKGSQEDPVFEEDTALGNGFIIE